MRHWYRFYTLIVASLRCPRPPKYLFPLASFLTLYHSLSNFPLLQSIHPKCSPPIGPSEKSGMANSSRQAVTYLGLRKECGFGDRDFSCLFRTLKHLLSDVKNVVGLEGRSKHGELYDRWLAELVNTAFSEIYFGATCNRIWLHGRDHAK